MGKQSCILITPTTSLTSSPVDPGDRHGVVLYVDWHGDEDDADRGRAQHAAWIADLRGCYGMDSIQGLYRGYIGVI